jgi:hypothetical protein
MELRKKSVAVLAGVAIAGLVGAAAASLGGLNTDSLGADADVVASCDTDGVSLSYTTSYDATSQSYEVDGVDVSGVDAACNGLSAELTLSGSNPDVAGSPTVEVTGTGTPDLDGTFTINLTSSMAAEWVDHAALVISS